MKEFAVKRFWMEHFMDLSIWEQDRIGIHLTTIMDTIFPG